MEMEQLFVEIYEAYLTGDITFRRKVDLIDLLDYTYAKYKEGHIFDTVGNCYDKWLTSNNSSTY